jgi:hypothetical protein
VLASLAASRTDALLADGESLKAALTGGYHVAFLVGAIFAAAAAGLGASLLRVPAQAAEELEEAAGEPCPGEPAPCNPFTIVDRGPSEQPA